MEFKDINALRSIEELEAYQEELKARAQALDAEYAGLPFPDDMREEFAKLATTRTEVSARITELKARHAYIRELADDEDRVERGGQDLARPIVTAAAAARRLVPENI